MQKGLVIPCIYIEGSFQVDWNSSISKLRGKETTNMESETKHIQQTVQIERLEREPICLDCPIINDRFNITLSAPAVKILYISLPKPASDAFPNTKPCLQNSSGGRDRTLEAPVEKQTIISVP